MNEHHDDETAATFRHLRHEVESTVDVERGLSDLHESSGTRRLIPGRTAVVGAAAALLLVAAVGSTALWRSSGSTDIVGGTPTGAADAPGDTMPPSEPILCGPQVVVVFVAPGARKDLLATVQATIDSFPGIESYDYIDSTATPEEFQQLFGDQLEFSDSVGSEELPRSFTLLPAQPMGEGELEQLRSIEGVLRVEASKPTIGQDDRCEPAELDADQPDAADSATTTTTTPPLPTTAAPGTAAPTTAAPTTGAPMVPPTTSPLPTGIAGGAATPETTTSAPR